MCYILHRRSLVGMGRRIPVVQVISNDRRVGRAMVAYLSINGAPSLAATGAMGYDELDAIDGQHPDIALCDLDGCDLTRALEHVRRLGAHHGVTVVAISVNAAAREAAMISGATHSVDKADDVEHLVSHLKAVANHRRMDYLIRQTPADRQQRETGLKTDAAVADITTDAESDRRSSPHLATARVTMPVGGAQGYVCPNNGAHPGP